jgi:hypothetical protein
LSVKNPGLQGCRGFGWYKGVTVLVKALCMYVYVCVCVRHSHFDQLCFLCYINGCFTVAILAADTMEGQRRPFQVKVCRQPITSLSDADRQSFLRRCSTGMHVSMRILRSRAMYMPFSRVFLWPATSSAWSIFFSNQNTILRMCATAKSLH